jgi:hypothetical protein
MNNDHRLSTTNHQLSTTNLPPPVFPTFGLPNFPTFRLPVFLLTTNYQLSTTNLTPSPVSRLPTTDSSRLSSFLSFVLADLQPFHLSDFLRTTTTNYPLLTTNLSPTPISGLRTTYYQLPTTLFPSFRLSDLRTFSRLRTN